MNTLDDYLEMYEKAISSASSDDYVVRPDVWIYSRWSEDSGFDKPIDAHNAISNVEDSSLRELLLAGEKIVLAVLAVRGAHTHG